MGPPPTPSGDPQPLPVKKSCSSPPVIYLDMNVWVQMAIGAKRADPRWIGVRDSLMAAVSSGSASVPLSASHYLELWHRGDATSRMEVARLMRDVSGYATLKPVQQVQRLEVGALARAAFTDSRGTVSVADLLGVGVNHAFDSPLGRLRLVESLAVDDTPEGPPSPMPIWLDLGALAGPAYEWNSLAGPQGLYELELDRTPEHRQGTEFAAGEQALRDWLGAEPKRRRHLESIIVAEEINALAQEIGESAAAYDQPPQALLVASERSQLRPPDAGRSFVRAMPTADVITAIRIWKHRDPSHAWDQHDKTDIACLAVAIPYCDIVVTERRWSHMASVTGLSERYGTTVVHGISAVEALLERGLATATKNSPTS